MILTTEEVLYFLTVWFSIATCTPDSTHYSLQYSPEQVRSVAESYWMVQSHAHTYNMKIHMLSIQAALEKPSNLYSPRKLWMGNVYNTYYTDLPFLSLLLLPLNFHIQAWRKESVGRRHSHLQVVHSHLHLLGGGYVALPSFCPFVPISFSPTLPSPTTAFDIQCTHTTSSILD